MICFHFCIFVVLATTVSARRQRGNALWFAFIFVSLSYWQQLRRAACSTRCCCDLLSFLYLCRTGNNRRCLRTATRRLWFAFIFVSLSYWQQHHVHADQHQHRCDLLSFLYLCRTGNNFVHGGYLFQQVVICFHFCIFVVLATTNYEHEEIPRCCDLLSFLYLCRTGNNIWIKTIWTAFVVICFHFCIFVVLATTDPEKVQLPAGCDLLSFLYLCRTGNNWRLELSPKSGVVICFHFCIFVVLATTACWRLSAITCCDLLSFLYLCRTGNNKRTPGFFPSLVVICFHFCIFVVLATTERGGCFHPGWLWFAFIFVSLSYWQQQEKICRQAVRGCDLLSFLYLCRTGNNRNNCSIRQPWLWFAFIFVSLSYWQQHTDSTKLITFCCDLLSFLYLCRTGNNSSSWATMPTGVVICFHFCIFVVLATT